MGGIEAFENVIIRSDDLFVLPRCRDDLFGCELDHLVDNLCNLEGLADKAVHTGWREQYEGDISTAGVSNRSGYSNGLPSII